MSTCCHRPTHTSVIHTFDCSNAFYICLFFVFVPSTCRSHLHSTNVFQRVYATICAAPWRLQKFIIHFTPIHTRHTHINISWPFHINMAFIFPNKSPKIPHHCSLHVIQPHLPHHPDPRQGMLELHFTGWYQEYASVVRIRTVNYPKRYRISFLHTAELLLKVESEIVNVPVA